MRTRTISQIQRSSSKTITTKSSLPSAEEQYPQVALKDTNSFESRLKQDPLLTAEDVAQRLNVSVDWVWDHSSRRSPQLPVIRMGDGTLRYRANRIEDFIDERERLTTLKRKKK